MSEIKPVYQVKPRFDWQEVDKDAFDDEVSKGALETRILYPAAAYEELNKENEELKEINDSLHRSSQFTYECQKKAIADLKAENETQAKRIEFLESKITELEKLTFETRLDNFAKEFEAKNGDSK